MRVAQARAVGRRWVRAEAAAARSFAGAFFTGSITALAPDAALPPTSDVDVKVVVAGGDAPAKLGKFVSDGVLLDVSFVAAERLRRAEDVLGDHVLAGGFRGAELIVDPAGRLAAVQARVARDFARRAWVRRRCAQAHERVHERLRGLRAGDPLADQVLAWVFATGGITHVLLVAGLRDPTVRRRYATVGELLAEHGRADVHELLLDLLGCRTMTRRRIAHHVTALARAFDAAAAVPDAPFFFVTDISPPARPVAIAGSSEMIAQGAHREAVFWMVATYAKCMKILDHGAPRAVSTACADGFGDLLADLGITSFADLDARRRRVETALPRIWRVAEEIVAGTPAIEDGDADPLVPAEPA